MTVIQEITGQTVDTTEKTAESIGKLTQMAHEMRESVGGFNLPEQR
jgi:twitching motility protein PilJ